MELRKCSSVGPARVEACGAWTRSWTAGQQAAELEAGSLLASAQALSGSVVRLAGAPIGVYVGDFPAILQQNVAATASFAAVAAFGALAWTCSASPSLSRSARRWSILGLAGLLGVAPIAAFAALGSPRNEAIAFGISMVVISGFWKLVELACRTGPKGFDVSFRQWMVYCGAPGEVALDAEGRIQQAPPGLLGECLRSLLGHWCLFLAFLIVGDLTDFVPGLPRGSDPASMPLFGFPWSVPALFLQTWTFYCFLQSILQFWRVVLALTGIATEVPFRQPMLLSTCIRDFWGRRWNLLIHRMMKRSVFTPCAKRMGPRLAAFAAFMASALFHEYMWVVTNWRDMNYMPGGPLLFFLLQFVFCTAEELLRATPLGRLAGALPGPAKTALTLLVPMPFAGLFLQGVFAGGVVPSMAVLLPRVVLTTS